MQWTPIQVQQSIIIAKAQGMRTNDIVRQYGVSRATVYRIFEKLRKTNPEVGNRLSGGRPDFSELKQTLLVDSHVAIDRSVKDEGEVHKAASTGLAYLKGIGEHGGEALPDVNVIVANVPAGFDELMSRHGLAKPVEVDAPAIESVPAFPETYRKVPKT